MEVMYKFRPEEVIQKMNYVGECFKLGSQPAKTGRGKRLYAQMIPEEFESDVSAMIDKCRRVYDHGMKNEVTLSRNDCIALSLLCDFVTALYRM